MSEVSLYARANRLCQIEQVPRHLVFVALQAFLKRKRFANDANAALQKQICGGNLTGSIPQGTLALQQLSIKLGTYKIVRTRIWILDG